MQRMGSARLIAFMLASSNLPAHAGYIDSTGREWRSPSETLTATPTEIVMPGTDYGCDPANGRCKGRLGGTGPDVDGWIWASLPSVIELFIELGAPGLDPMPALPLAVSGITMPWVDALLDTDGPGGPDTGAFDPTSGLLGTTSTTAVAGSARTFQDRSYIFDVRHASGQADTFTIVEVPRTTVGPDRGLWLHRTAVPVSAGGTLASIALGAAALALITRRSRLSGTCHLQPESETQPSQERTCR